MLFTPATQGGRRFAPAWALAALAAVVVLGACDTSAPKVKTPARLVYLEGQALLDEGLFNEAITKFEEVVTQNPGSLLGNFAYLRLAEVAIQQEQWADAETNFRLFLRSNQSPHLSPYVIYQLMRVNHESSYSGLLFRSRDVERDMQPNREIIQEFRRFFFLYPGSVFMRDVQGFAADARQSLAAHERLVADYYFDRELYVAAAGRYLYLLRNYPDYPETAEAVQRLLTAYRRSQQPSLARELEQVLAAQPAVPEPGGQDGAKSGAEGDSARLPGRAPPDAPALRPAPTTPDQRTAAAP